MAKNAGEWARVNGEDELESKLSRVWASQVGGRGIASFSSCQIKDSMNCFGPMVCPWCNLGCTDPYDHGNLAKAEENYYTRKASTAAFPIPLTALEDNTLTMVLKMNLKLCAIIFMTHDGGGTVDDMKRAPPTG
jgi:hypothetical protein